MGAHRLAALPIFLSIRAAIRAKVTAANLVNLSGGARNQAASEARRHFRFAEDLLTPEPARMVAIGGLSGTGKGALAGQTAPTLGRAPGAVWLLTLPSAPNAAMGGEIVLGVRPAHLTRGGPNPIAAQVLRVEPTGGETFVTLRLGDAILVCVLRDRLATRPGETLPISLETAPLHFFDAATGEAFESRRR